jgi:hypothetical protein
VISQLFFDLLSVPQIHGPAPQSRTWARYREISPALPILSAVIDQFDQHFSDFYRSRQHHVPDSEKDISRVLEKQLAAGIHKFSPARATHKSNIIGDSITLGEQHILYSNYLAEYAEKRQKYYEHTTTLEVYEDQGIDMDQIIGMVVQNQQGELPGSSGGTPIEETQVSQPEQANHVTPNLVASPTINAEPLDPEREVVENALDTDSENEGQHISNDSEEEHQNLEHEPDDEMDQMINALHYFSFGYS